MPEITASVWRMANIASMCSVGDDSPDRIHTELSRLWDGQVLHAMQSIEQWRRSYQSSQGGWNIAAVGAVMTRGQRGGLHTARIRALQTSKDVGSKESRLLTAFLDKLVVRHQQALTSTTGVSAGTNDPPVYVLFFDGGSRGNPGPRGSGAIIVRVHPDTVLSTAVWAGSISYGNKETTNNYAEYQGLVLGLQAANRYDHRPLHVVGDSNMILTQLRNKKSPKCPRLQHLYRAARQLADRTGVGSWTHHYRRYNKMADQLANAAMDAKASAQDK
jgi:ribonuclease HI